MSPNKIWTIGHSTHPFDEFVDMLKSFQIQAIADVRSYPGSRKFPQYNKESLRVSLPENGIEYVHIKNLGGRRKENPKSKHTVWRNTAFRGYADYMDTEDFKDGIKELIEIAEQKKVAYMCSEAVWWRCHRSMISDYLKAKGRTVMHIMAIHKADEHPYTAPAEIVNGELSYPEE